MLYLLTLSLSHRGTNFQDVEPGVCTQNPVAGLMSEIGIYRQPPQFVYNSGPEAECMTGFDKAWAAVAQPKFGELVSPELQPLLRQVYSNVLAKPVNLPALKASLTTLLEYLNTPGRTNANCRAVDMFFGLSEGWEQDWTEQNLPEDFHEVLALMSVHDRKRNELFLPDHVRPTTPSIEP